MMNGPKPQPGPAPTPKPTPAPAKPTQGPPLPKPKPAGERDTAEPGTKPKTVAVSMKNLEGLDPTFKTQVISILQELAGKGWIPVVAEGVRDKAQQQKKVDAGYSKTMNSRHLTGHAVDIVDRRYGWGGPAAKLDHAFWTDLGAAANSRGLEWGGDWKSFKDVAHVQVPWKKKATLPDNPPLPKPKPKTS
jgi:hypothetical protein